MPFNQALRKNSHVLWTISMVQDQNPTTQTKEEFSQMSQDVIETQNIQSLSLCLASELQRFRIMIEYGFNESAALSMCQQLESQWHENNTASLQKLNTSKNFSFLTWKEFLAWPDYANTLYSIEKWYKEDREFRHDVDGRIRQARENFSVAAKIQDPNEQTALLKKYLFEECAFQKFAASKGFKYELYKTPMSRAMRRVKRNTDFVASGILTEIYFTQFNPIVKKQTSNMYSFSGEQSQSPIRQETMEVENKNSFLPVFNKKSPPASPPLEHSPSTRVAEFIEKTLAMLPPAQQQKGIEALLKFTTKELIPLCYDSSVNVHYENNVQVLKI